MKTWFDTKNVFGNGEYQQYSNERGGLDLYNVKYNCSIIFSVDGKFEEYYITHCQQMISNGDLIIVNKFSDFNSEEQNILKDL